MQQDFPQDGQWHLLVQPPLPLGAGTEWQLPLEG